MKQLKSYFRCIIICNVAKKVLNLGAVLSAVINMHLQGAYRALKRFMGTLGRSVVDSIDKKNTLSKSLSETLEESDAELLDVRKANNYVCSLDWE